MSEIISLDDLKDGRSRKLAKEYGLDVREILPKYLELHKELRANDGEIKFDIEAPDILLNIYDDYRRKLACGAVICYELTKRETVRFPLLDVLFVGQVTFLAKYFKGRFYRSAPINVCEKQGKYYEAVIGLLNEHQKANLDRILGK